MRVRTGHILTILTILTMLTLLGSLCACAADTGTGTQSSLTPAATAPMRTPTPSKPTIPASATTLGGSVVSFDKKFGANNCCYRNGWQYQGPFGQQMWTGIDTGSHDSNVDEGSTERVIEIENYGPVMSYLNISLAQAKSLCGSFLPSDARLQHTGTASLGGIADGIELRYTSTLLANTLPASDFTDKNGKATPPGTFFAYYHNPGGLVDDCTLTTDESLLLI